MTPIYRINANGQDITKALQERTASIEVQDSDGTDSDSCTITCSRRNLIIPPTGAQLEVKFGYASPSSSLVTGHRSLVTPTSIGPNTSHRTPLTGLWAMGIFAVDEIEVSHTSVSIRAKAASFSKAGGLKDTIKSQVSRSWDSLTFGDIVSTIANQHGYKPVISPELESVTISHIDQTDESDLHFLTRLAKDYGASAKPAAGHLIVVERGRSKSASGSSIPPVTLALSDLEPNWRITIKDRGKFQSVQASWYDHGAGEKKVITAGNGEPARKLHRVYATEAEANRAATAEYRRLNQGTQSLSCTVSGSPIFAETPLAIEFGDPLLASDWVVTQATHTINQSGYKVGISAEVQQ